MAESIWVPPDVERVVKDHVKALLVVRGRICTAGLGVPSDWTTKSLDHVQVGAASAQIRKAWGPVPPIDITGPVQLTVWSKNATDAKALANLCLGLLIVAPVVKPLTQIVPGTGTSTTRDPRTRGELAFFNVIVSAEPVLAG